MAGGRPSQAKEWLEKDNLILIEGWARDGLSDEQIASNMGISAQTFYRWKKKFCQICEALKKGKAPVDYEVENQLLKSALGFTITIKEPIKVKTKKQLAGKGTIEEERIEYVDKEIYVPANITAQIFWLKNRRSDKWRDKQVIENLGNGQLADLIDGLKEPIENDSLHGKTENGNEPVAEEQTETD